ncbi:MAG: DUF177 domain-containing protein [Bacteroidales bacterium]
MNKADNIEYVIPIKGLSVGKYHYDFTVGGDFFREYENRDIDGAQLKISLTLDKHATFIDVKGIFKGAVTTKCDRCLGELEVEIDFTASLLVKFGEITQGEESEEIITLDPSESDLDLKQFFYDYIYLALPIQRVHKEDECDLEMLEKLQNYRVTNVEERKNSPFEKLKNLMN